jgi:hypothetical protein
MQKVENIKGVIAAWISNYYFSQNAVAFNFVQLCAAHVRGVSESSWNIIVVTASAN